MKVCTHGIVLMSNFTNACTVFSLSPPLYPLPRVTLLTRLVPAFSSIEDPSRNFPAKKLDWFFVWIQVELRGDARVSVVAVGEGCGDEGGRDLACISLQKDSGQCYLLIIILNFR